MEKKQTAVDWFAVNAMGLQIALREKNISLSQFGDKYNEYLERAKQMQKEQILLARLNGFEESAEGWNGEYPTMTKEETILRIKNEEYYNENYL